MYRVALAAVLGLAVLDLAAACPPAKSRVVVINGKETVEWYCSPKEVLYSHENHYLCFPTCPSCLNGFCDNGKCHCFPGTHEERPGVCGQICPNCENGWCSSMSKCECYDGYTMIDGKCVHSYLLQHLLSQLKQQQLEGAVENPLEKPDCD